MKRTTLFAVCLYLSAALATAQGNERDFVKGADVGFLTGQERQGQKFYDVKGNERECLELAGRATRTNCWQWRSG